MRKYCIYLLCTLLLLIATTAQAAPPIVTDTAIKVYDGAGLLTDVESADLQQKAAAFADEYQLDFVILTIDDDGGKVSMAYADDFYDNNGFGYGEGYDGLLFLINMDERALWISTTGSAIDVFSDARIEAMLDAAYDHVTNGDFAAACGAVIDKASYYLAVQVPVEPEKTLSPGGYATREPSYPEPVYPAEPKAGLRGERLGPSAIGGAIIAGIVVLIMRSAHRKVKTAGSAGTYMQKDSFSLSQQRHTFVRTSLNRVAIPKDPPPSSGGRSSGGGSSTHVSSSGRTHGGGGRKF